MLNSILSNFIGYTIYTAFCDLHDLSRDGCSTFASRDVVSNG